MELITESASATRQLAQALGERLKSGDFIVLTGELGAGKTCFTQGLAAGLGVNEQINSPTYIIFHIHSGRVPFYHFDLYRLESPEELEAIGYEDYYYGGGVTVVEWGDKLSALLPDEFLTIEFHREKNGDDRRLLRILANGKRASELLAEVGDLADNLGLNS